MTRDEIYEKFEMLFNDSSRELILLTSIIDCFDRIIEERSENGSDFRLSDNINICHATICSDRVVFKALLDYTNIYNIVSEKLDDCREHHMEKTVSEAAKLIKEYKNSVN